jgi:hypothetical protein
MAGFGVHGCFLAIGGIAGMIAGAKQAWPAPAPPCAAAGRPCRLAADQ